MSQEKVKRAFDYFEQDDFSSSEEELRDVVRSRMNQKMKDTLGLQNDVYDDVEDYEENSDDDSDDDNEE